jgi:prolyl-tRNA synthetase
MRFSHAFIPTLRDDPAEAEIVSHKLMVRAGLLRKAAAGFYSWMPLGWRVLRKVENIVREEMDRAGCLELLMPVLQPRELWDATGRWGAYGDEMMRVKDRHGREFCLGPTHEEMITSIAKELRSYKDLPKCFYQIQIKFRDEIRPRFGVMRSREFLMKDAYSFHADEESLRETYERMEKAYSRIVERCGLTYRLVKAAAGLIGGAVSEEFMVLSDTGEDIVIYCPNCNYAANLETATSKWHVTGEEEPLRKRAVKHTPGKRSVEEVAALLDIDSGRLVKTLILKAGDQVVAALVPGNKELNPAKLAAILGVGEAHFFTEEEFAARPDLVSGFVGPVDLKDVKIVADHSIKGLRNFVTGANVIDHHYIDVNEDEDFAVDIWTDLVFAEVGEGCPQCEDGRLETMRGIEVGHIFQLGSKYSRLLGAEYIDEGGVSHPFIMGCYGVGVSRIVAAAIEQKHDAAGIIWPASIAPYDAHLIALGKDESVRAQADEAYVKLSGELDVLYDDRRVSAGIKFSDADLIGIPYQIIMGKRFAETSKVELKVREDGRRVELGVEELPDWIKQDRTNH